MNNAYDDRDDIFADQEEDVWDQLDEQLDKQQKRLSKRVEKNNNSPISSTQSLSPVLSQFGVPQTTFGYSSPERKFDVPSTYNINNNYYQGIEKPRLPGWLSLDRLRSLTGIDAVWVYGPENKYYKLELGSGVLYTDNSGTPFNYLPADANVNEKNIQLVWRRPPASSSSFFHTSATSAGSYSMNTLGTKPTRKSTKRAKPNQSLKTVKKSKKQIKKKSQKTKTKKKSVRRSKPTTKRNHHTKHRKSKHAR